MRELENIVKEVNKLCESTDKILNDLDKEELRLELDGEKNTEDYWETPESLLNKTLSCIKKLDEADFKVIYYDADENKGIKNKIILNFENDYVIGKIDILDKKDFTYNDIVIVISKMNKNFTNIDFYHLKNMFEILDDIVN